jgi:molybdenum-dependent DNA-binding transcriptional regulator ModE
MRWADRVGRFLKPRDLHVFMTVVEESSMAKAAERLAISRPVISRTIANLEHMLGVTLLDRTARGIEPTLFGKALLRRGTAVFDELRQSVEEIAFLTDPPGGRAAHSLHRGVGRWPRAGSDRATVTTTAAFARQAGARHSAASVQPASGASMRNRDLATADRGT